MSRVTPDARMAKAFLDDLGMHARTRKGGLRESDEAGASLSMAGFWPVRA